MKNRFVHLLALTALAASFAIGTAKAAEQPPVVEHEHDTTNGTIKHEEPHSDSAAKIHCVDPHACCAESEKVLETLQTLTKAYIHGDVKTIETHLDEHCTTFDENTGKLVTGKANVVADLKRKFEKYAPTGETPLLTFTIDHPYAKVTGDTAVVTFVAYREIGGRNPIKQKSSVTDIFVKHDGIWKKVHYRGAWKKV
jgi:ketosteroid isomerase-like protein